MGPLAKFIIFGLIIALNSCQHADASVGLLFKILRNIVSSRIDDFELRYNSVHLPQVVSITNELRQVDVLAKKIFANSLAQAAQKRMTVSDCTGQYSYIENQLYSLQCTDETIMQRANALSAEIRTIISDDRQKLRHKQLQVNKCKADHWWLLAIEKCILKHKVDLALSEWCSETRYNKLITEYEENMSNLQIELKESCHKIVINFALEAKSNAESVKNCIDTKVTNCPHKDNSCNN